MGSIPRGCVHDCFDNRSPAHQGVNMSLTGNQILGILFGSRWRKMDLSKATHKQRYHVPCSLGDCRNAASVMIRLDGSDSLVCRECANRPIPRTVSVIHL